MIPLSVLDLSVVTTATKPAAALRNSIDLARHVDGIGYVRYWLAEHHNLASVASPAPDLMIGQIAAVNQNIRVGAGGRRRRAFGPLPPFSPRPMRKPKSSRPRWTSTACAATAASICRCRVSR